MAKISVFYRNNLYSEFELDKRLTLGRQKTNDVHLDESTVSGHHALVESRDDHYCVEDLGSTNGTTLGGRRIGRVGLRDGDEFRIGPFRITFQGPSAPPSFQDTMILKLDDIARGADLGEIAKAANGVADTELDDSEYRIEVLNGDNSGETILLEEDITTVGVPGQQVAAVTRRRDGFYLVPVAGSHPTVNGQESGPQAARLNNGDEVEIAGVKLAFRH